MKTSSVIVIGAGIGGINTKDPSTQDSVKEE
jgi:hypothetical protein